MKDFIKEICPEFDKLIESEIFSDQGKSIGWYSSAILNDSTPLGGGVAMTRSKARRIALAELAERSLYKMIDQSQSAEEFLIDEFPSTSGFAFGFENRPTMLRAVAEASERWIWSKWIDEGYIIERKILDKDTLSPLSKYFMKDFDDVLFIIKNSLLK